MGKLVRLHETLELEFFSVDTTSEVEVPYFITPVSAGFPSPADDYIEFSIDLNQYLIKNKASTFLVRVKGNSMLKAGLTDGSLLVVDKALEPQDNDVVICFLNGEFTCKRIHWKDEHLFLIPENDEFKPTLVTEEMNFEVFGVVTYVINQPFRVRSR